MTERQINNDQEFKILIEEEIMKLPLIFQGLVNNLKRIKGRNQLLDLQLNLSGTKIIIKEELIVSFKDRENVTYKDSNYVRNQIYLLINQLKKFEELNDEWFNNFFGTDAKVIEAEEMTELEIQLINKVKQETAFYICDKLERDIKNYLINQEEYGAFHYSEFIKGFIKQIKREFLHD